MLIVKPINVMIFNIYYNTLE